MDLRQYWDVLWRRKWIVLLTANMALFIALLLSLLTPARYTATATLRIATTQTGPVLDQRGYDMSYTDRLVNTYSQLATSGPVLNQLSQKLGLAKPPVVTVSIPANTELMRISTEDADPGRAANAANALAQILIDNFKTQYTQTGKTASQILNNQLTQNQADLDAARKNYDAAVAKNPPNQEQINAARAALDAQQQQHNQILAQLQQAQMLEANQANVISLADPAIPPATPSKPNVPLNLGLGLLVGLVGGLGLAFLFENMDSTLHTTEQVIDATKETPIGWIPKAKGSRRSVIFKEHSLEAESMRRLRTNLALQDHGNPPSTVLVTSAESGEGKSTVAANLARAYGQSGRGIMLVDTDLRMPVLHKLFNVSNTQGLSSVLQRQVPANDVMHYTRIPGVWMMPSGPVPANPAELLGSVEMKNLLKQLKERFDVIVLDSAPFLPVADTAVLAPAMDEVLLVVARDHSHRDAVRAALEQLRESQVHSLGVVVNLAERDGNYAYYDHKPLKVNA